MAGVKKILQNSCLIFAVCLICCTIKVQAKYFKHRICWKWQKVMQHLM